MKRKMTKNLIAALLLIAPALSFAAQGYPARPVRIVVPVPAGGGVDSLARVVGQHFNALWGQPFIVDNRPGAGGSLGAEIVSRATWPTYCGLTFYRRVLAVTRDSSWEEWIFTYCPA